MDGVDLRTRIDRHSPTWQAVEEYLRDQIKNAHERLELVRETGLERVDQGRIQLCRDLLEAAKPVRPDGERGTESGTNYGMQGF